MLEVACSRCERGGRLQVDRLIEQHGDAELPELRLILAGDCPKAEVPSIGERCSIYFPQLSPKTRSRSLARARCTGKKNPAGNGRREGQQEAVGLQPNRPRCQLMPPAFPAQQKKAPPVAGRVLEAVLPVWR